MTLAALFVPALAHATDVPVAILFVVPLAVAIGVTAMLWFVLGRIATGTARAFLRMLLIVILWTPLPNSGEGFIPALPSGVFLWFLGAAGSDARLTLAISVGTTAVLGALVIVIRSAFRFYGSPDRR
jgi:hypothetical protein